MLPTTTRSPSDRPEAAGHGEAQTALRQRFHLLRLCARTTGVPRATLGEALAAGVDARPLVEEASFHGVLPLLYHQLKAFAEWSVPRDVVALARARVGGRLIHGACLAEELDRLAGLFDEASLPVIAVKGLPLAQELYGGYALRPFGDADLFIRRRDFGRMRALLESEGYQGAPIGRQQERLYLLVHGQYAFWNRMPALGGILSVLDVHTALLPFGYSYAEPFEDLWERARPFTLGRHSVRVLAPEDLLLVLCFHGFKNRWEALKYTADVAELVRTYPELDWELAQRRAASAQGLRVFRVALLLAADVLDAPVPAEVLAETRRDPRAVEMARNLIERLPAQPHRTGSPLGARVRFNLGAQDSWRGQLRYGGYTVVRRLSELFLPSES